jgi:hypothetical protein
MDPAPGNIFHPGSMHKYGYTWNNPVNHADPTGKGILDEATLIGEVLLKVTVRRSVLALGLAACPVIVIAQDITTAAGALGIEVPDWLGGDFADQLLDTAKEYCEAYFPGD